MRQCILLIISCFGVIALCAQPSPPRPDIITPDNTIFAIDLHGIVAQPDWKGARKALWESGIIKSILLRSLNPRFAYNFYWCFSGGIALTEKRMAIAAKRYPILKQLGPLFMDLANFQHPIVESINIVRKLKEAGYRIVLFSNIGEMTYKKFAQKFVDIDALFHDRFVVNAADNFVHKPHDDAYILFLERFNPQGKHVVFIDDRQENIKASKKHNITGVFYNPKKGNGNLYEKLIALNVQGIERTPTLESAMSHGVEQAPTT